jgi:hypothetical protein
LYLLSSLSTLPPGTTAIQCPQLPAWPRWQSTGPFSHCLPLENISGGLAEPLISPSHLLPHHSRSFRILLSQDGHSATCCLPDHSTHVASPTHAPCDTASWEVCIAVISAGLMLTTDPCSAFAWTAEDLHFCVQAVTPMPSCLLAPSSFSHGCSRSTGSPPPHWPLAQTSAPDASLARHCFILAISASALAIPFAL